MEAILLTAPVNTISGHKVPIGVNVPAGLAYGMYISAISPGTLSLYRNTTNASYPYNYGNVASITQVLPLDQLTFISSFIIGIYLPLVVTVICKKQLFMWIIVLK